MKKNGPVIDEEVEVGESDLLVSKTDTKGIIQYASPDFCRICGFDPHEMMGQPHNLIRHPDVPPAVFKELWETVKSGRPWNGVVKNRSKSGKFYWVDATITAVRGGGEITGYISVRRKPSSSQIENAKKLYARLWRKNPDGKNSMGSYRSFWMNSVGLVSVLMLQLIPTFLIGLGMFQSNFHMAWIGVFLTPVGILPTLYFRSSIQKFGKVDLNQVLNFDRKSGKSEELQKEESGNSLIISLHLTLRSFNTSLSGIVQKIDIVSDQLRSLINTVQNTLQEFSQFIQEHSNQMRSISGEIEEMASANERVSEAIGEETSAFGSVVKRLESFSETMRLMGNSMRELSRMAEEARSQSESGRTFASSSQKAMAEISENSAKIQQFVELIREIANRTDLLSLNASIEAARSQAGNGFAVVAKEIGKLADDSAQNLEEIGKLVDKTQAVVNTGSQEVSETAKILNDVISRIQTLADSVYSSFDAIQLQADQSAEIESIVKKAHESVQEIDSASREQRVALHSLADKVVSVSQETENMSQKMERLEESLLEIKEPIQYIQLLTNLVPDLVGRSS